MIYSYLIVSLICILSLIIVLNMAIMNNSIDIKRKNVYITSIIITIIIIMCDMICSYCNGQLENNYVRILYYIVSIIIFSLSAFLPIIFSYVFNFRYHRINYLLLVPCLICSFMAFLSPWTSWIFYVGKDDCHTRGDLYFIFVIAYIFGLAVLWYQYFQCSKHYYDHNAKITLYLAYSLVILGAVIQTNFIQIKSAWLCVSIAFILYYVVMIEMNVKLDVLTTLYNRRAFETDKAHIIPTPRTALIIFDVDNFKNINDDYGHSYGDYCLSTIGLSLKVCFSGYGKCYRIGGDEFCVIANGITENKMRICFNKFINMIRNYRSEDHKFPMVSFGYAFFTNHNKMSFDGVFESADKELYTYKSIRKQGIKNEL